MSMSHIEREIVSDGRTNEKKEHIVLEMSCVRFEHEIYICEYRERSGECVMGCIVHGVQKGNEELHVQVITQ